MINKRVTLFWLRELIEQGDLSPFYNTKEWARLREYKRQLEHYECERCRAKGKYRRGKNVHHKKYLRLYPELALTLSNLENLCDECHYEEHHKKDNEDSIIPERW